jgi:uncharacterized membrane-anchored protein
MSATAITNPASQPHGKPSRKRLLIGVILAFILQAGLLSAMVLDRALLLARGTEIRLPVIPVDPRDFLRGDYVVLSYPLSRISSDLIEGWEALSVDQTVYVTLRRDGAAWLPASAAARPPQSGLFLKGKVESVSEGGSQCPSPCRTFQIEYNLEKFFVPEGEGLSLEGLRNNQRIEVDVAIASDGRAALKRLLVDGAVRHQDTLF